jgi:plastocyanin domain-containing protein
MKRIKVSALCLVIFTLCFAFAAIGQIKVQKAVIDKDGIQRVNMLAGNYFFDPNHIIVRIDVPVEITIKREPGITPHDFVIKEPDAGIDISETLSTEPKIIKFTPKKPGTYPFYCTKKLLFLKSHREKGMEGIIEVVQ